MRNLTVLNLSVLSVAAVLSLQNAVAAPERVLYDFPKNSAPLGRVLGNASGTFYATTYGPGNGAAYLLRLKHGAWQAKTLHQFGSGDGQNPQAGLVQDPNDGSLYGTTLLGGTHGYGTIYRLTPAGGGWTETVLHNFTSSDGKNPVAELRRDGTTNVIYGTASGGGSLNCGTVFQYDPSSSVFKVLYEFAGGSDGCTPTVQLRPGAGAGTLIGATQYGGGHNAGSVFRLSQKGGVWKEEVIHAFDGGDGASPSDLDVADDGAVYGVALGGGSQNAGVVFRLSPRTGKYKTLHTFDVTDGCRPVGINLQSGGTTIYGTTEIGGYGEGVVFRLQLKGKQWEQKVLYKFFGGNADGGHPEGRPAIDAQSGNLYGTTRTGGAHNGGIFYSVTP